MNIIFNLINMLLIAVFSILMMMSAFQAQAAVLTFDDLKLNNNNGYEKVSSRKIGGFTWGSSWQILDTQILDVGGAYKAHSGKKLLMNGDDHQRNLTITREDDFDFKGFYVSKPKYTHNRFKGLDSKWVRARGFDASGKVIASTGKINLTTDMTWVFADFKNVRKVDFLYEGSKKYFSLDSLHFETKSTAEVPIPAAALLFAPALLGFMGIRRKVKAKI